MLCTHTHFVLSRSRINSLAIEQLIRKLHINGHAFDRVKIQMITKLIMIKKNTRSCCINSRNKIHYTRVTLMRCTAAPQPRDH